MSEGVKDSVEEKSEFGKLLKYTVLVYASGLFVGVLLDFLGLQRSSIGQWIVRALSGEGESIFDRVYALRRRFHRKSGSIAEAYGGGKFLPYLYALSAQMGANISGLVFLRKKERSWSKAINQYVRHPVMLTSLLVIFIVPIRLLVTRLMGFSPTAQVYTALETIPINLCWLPPLVGWLKGKLNLLT